MQDSVFHPARKVSRCSSNFEVDPRQERVCFFLFVKLPVHFVSNFQFVSGFKFSLEYSCILKIFQFLNAHNA